MSRDWMLRRGSAVAHGALCNPRIKLSFILLPSATSPPQFFYFSTSHWIRTQPRPFVVSNFNYQFSFFFFQFQFFAVKYKRLKKKQLVS